MAELSSFLRLERATRGDEIFATYGYRYYGFKEDRQLKNWNVPFHICHTDKDGLVRGIFGVYGVASMGHIENTFLKEKGGTFELFGLRYAKDKEWQEIHKDGLMVVKCLFLFLEMELDRPTFLDPFTCIYLQVPLCDFEWNVNEEGIEWLSV